MLLHITFYLIEQFWQDYLKWVEQFWQFYYYIEQYKMNLDPVIPPKIDFTSCDEHLQIHIVAWATSLGICSPERAV